jgi:hypothetical protein
MMGYSQCGGLVMAERVIALEVPFFDPEPNIAEPVVVQSERACFLVYWDRDMKRKALEFTHCSISKFGYPNDDGRWGHRLQAKGLGSYGVFEVIESEWLAELRKGNAKAFPDYKAFEGERHFIFSFHDSTFECIALEFIAVSEFPQVNSKLLRMDESL